jgi:hypothetical protein
MCLKHKIGQYLMSIKNPGRYFATASYSTPTGRPPKTVSNALNKKRPVKRPVVIQNAAETNLTPSTSRSRGGKGSHLSPHVKVMNPHLRFIIQSIPSVTIDQLISVNLNGPNKLPAPICPKCNRTACAIIPLASGNVFYSYIPRNCIIHKLYALFYKNFRGFPTNVLPELTVLARKILPVSTPIVLLDPLSHHTPKIAVPNFVSRRGRNLLTLGKFAILKKCLTGTVHCFCTLYFTIVRGVVHKH